MKKLIPTFLPFQIFEYIQRDAAGIYECLVHEQDREYPLVTAELVVVGELMTEFRLKITDIVKFGE